MIRINLAKSQNYASAGTQTAIQIDANALGSGGPHPAVKLILMVIFVAPLYYYEQTMLEQKRRQLASVLDEANRVETESSQLGPITNVVRELSEQKVQLNKQIDVIRKISQKRAYKMTSIMEIQKLISEDMWLSEMTIDDGAVRFSGFSRSPLSIQSLVDSLNNHDSIESAINRKLSLRKLKGEELNTFDIEARLKN